MIILIKFMNTNTNNDNSINNRKNILNEKTKTNLQNKHHFKNLCPPPPLVGYIS